MNDDSSKKTRREALRAGLALTGMATGMAVAAATARRAYADDDGKVAKESVQYQEQPKDGNKCSMCVNFQAPNACVVVSGVINPNGWCAAYAPKSS